MSEAHQIDEGAEEVIERDYEAEGRQLGWHPKEEFRGNPDDWVDAKAFVIRGETRLPILQENNRKLIQRTRRDGDEIAELKSTVEAMNASLTTLRTMAERSNEAGYQRALADLEAQQKQAVVDGDLPRYEHIAGEIKKVEDTREGIRTAGAAPAPNGDGRPKGPVGSPEFQAWEAENRTWLQADPVLARAALTAELELKNSDDDLSEAEIWDGVRQMVKERFPRKFARATGESPEASPAPAGPTRRAAAGVLSPTGGAPSSQRKGGIDAIADPEERKAARAAFNSIKRSIPDYKEEEYMRVYTDPKADTIADATKRKVAQNGQNRRIN